MKTRYYLLLLLIVGPFCAKTQTIVSPNIDFSIDKQGHVLLTNGGDHYIGKILSIQNDTIEFQMRSLANTLHFNFNEVSFLGVLGENIDTFTLGEGTTAHQKNRKSKSIPIPSNQLLYSATALPYPGKGVYRNTMLFINQVEVQPNEHFSFSIGSFIPSLISVRLQAKTSVNEFVHVGAVFQEHFLLFDSEFVTHAYGVITVGKHDRYLNLGFGYWINHERRRFGGFDRRTSSPSFTLGGSYTFDNNWRLYTETMVVVDQFETFIIPSFTIAKHLHKTTWEIGLVGIPDSGLPLLPLISYNRSF